MNASSCACVEQVGSPAGRAVGYVDRCVHELFEEQVLRTPEAPAVVCGARTLTYAALNARANAVARVLQAHGVGPDAVVGICLEPSLEAAVGVLAILKAGGANLTLATSLPPARVAALVRASGARTMVTSSSLAQAFGLDDVVTVCLDAIADEPLDARNVRSGARLDTAAFVRYTSGSTGQPRAVLNTHRSFVSRLSQLPLPDIQAGDVCGINTTQGFGARFFYPLALGATLVLIPDATIQDADALTQLMRDHRITSLYMVPTLLRQVLAVAHAVAEPLVDVRAISVGGEALTPDIIDRFWTVMPNAALINLYGSTEIGTSAALRIVPRATPDWRTLGAPVANTTIHVLAQDFTPVGPDTVGELCVASAHLARGYLGMPGITARQFVPDPLSGEAGGRLYRTGDLARRTPDGGIELVGRVDHQVKIRGFRVELGEIEAELLTHDAVDGAAVITRQSGTDTRLIAYAAPKPQCQLQALTLRQHLQQRLPPYMLPSAFVILEAMPLTASGKVDRRSLPPVDGNRPPDIGAYEGPRNDVEAALVRIWEDVFDLTGIGVHDHIADLGGDSLIATRAAAVIRRELGVDLAAQMLYELPTVAEVAAHVAARTSADGAAGAARVDRSAHQS